MPGILTGCGSVILGLAAVLTAISKFGKGGKE
jgi:hypothetical protein